MDEKVRTRVGEEIDAAVAQREEAFRAKVADAHMAGLPAKDIVQDISWIAEAELEERAAMILATVKRSCAPSDTSHDLLDLIAEHLTKEARRVSEVATQRTAWAAQIAEHVDTARRRLFDSLSADVRLHIADLKDG